MNSTIRKGARRPRLGLERLEGRALLANAGALDPSFGNQGLLTIPPTNLAIAQPANPELSAMDSGGKFLQGGSYTAANGTYFTIERLDPDGSPDLTFGTGGFASFAVSTSTNLATRGMATVMVLGPNGSIILAGNLGGTAYGAIRVTSSGTLDASFGTNGIATLPTVAGSNLDVSSVGAAAFTADGHLILVGRAQDNAGNASIGGIYAARLDGQGTLDLTFGTSGIATDPITLNGFESSMPTSMIIQASGRIVVAGTAENGTVPYAGIPYVQEIPVVIGLTAAGSLDPTFGPANSGGVFVLPSSFAPYASVGNREDVTMAMRPDGRLVLDVNDAPAPLALAGQPSSSLAGLTVDGTFDPTFGTGGTVHLAGPLVAENVAIEGDGKIVLPGYVFNTELPSNSTFAERFAAGRYNADGTPDTTFGQPATPGLATYPSAYQANNLLNAFFDTSGHIILSGFYFRTGVASTPTPILFRAFASATTTPAVSQPPADLAGTSTTDLAVYLTDIGAFAFISASGMGGHIIPFGGPGQGQVVPAVADYQGVGHAQLAAYLPQAGIYAVRPATGPDKYYPFGTPGAGQTIPVPADYDGDGKADVAIYLVASGSFAILPSDGSPGRTIQFGTPGPGHSIPAPADYFGTGHDDLGVYLADLGGFAVADPAGQHQAVFVPFGPAGVGKAIPVPGDYDGSGHVELAIYIPSLAEFIYRPFNGTGDVTVPFGTPNSGQLPAPGDYDGVGHTEFALYDPNIGEFIYRPANGGPDVTVPFGTPNNKSIPLATPAGALPEFLGSGSGSGGGGNAFRPSFSTPGSGSGSTNGVALTKASAIPSVSTLASARFARALINQGTTDSSKLTL